MSTSTENNNYEEDFELLKSLHNFYKNIKIKENNDNILIKYLNDKKIIKNYNSDSLFLFINELSKQIQKGNNIILPFIDPCYDLIEAYIFCNNEKEKEIFIDNNIFIQLIENSFINRKNLIPIYSYLTEIYSNVDELNENDEMINKFPKIVGLWKLFYLLSENKSKKNFNSLSSFCFIGSGLVLSGLKNLPENISLVLKIIFLNNNFLHYINEKDDLISSEDCNIQYSTLFILQKGKKENINSIELIFINNTIKININNCPIEFGKPFHVDNFNILNNFYGQIKSFEIKFVKHYLNNTEEKIYSKTINPFPIKHCGNIFNSNFQINKKLNLERNFTLELQNQEYSDLNLDIYKSNENDDNYITIKIELKIQDSNLIKVNYINYKEDNFNIIDYFGGIVQLLPFLKIINGLYRNTKILDKIGKIDFLIEFVKNVLLIIFNHINNSGYKKQEYFKLYWNFYIHLLNKIEPFKDIKAKIDIEEFSFDKLNDYNKNYFEMFRLFLEAINSKEVQKNNNNIQNSFKDIFSKEYFKGREETYNINLFSKTNNQLYRHLMKELFIYNRLWSRQYFFFKKFPDCYKNKDKEIIKFKRINNYTCNFQQPLIYPILEINKYYPKFKNFKLDNLYKNMNNEIILNYDFSFDKFDNNLIDEKLVENFLDNNKKTNHTEKCCLIKKMYHVKGEIEAIFNQEKKSKNKIFFFPNLKEEKKCNKQSKENEYNSNLCYGSVFQCLEKEEKRILVIPINKILFVLLRIYFYRNTGLEIFTIDNKSYYFNFWEPLRINGNHIIIQIFERHLKFIKDSENKILGWFNPDYMDLLKPLFNEEIFIWNKKNYFYSNFDKLMIINLFSNRSFNDLYQYPIFPMLYDEIDKKRNMEQHIGFQELTKESRERKELFQNSFLYAQSFGEEESTEEKFYFNTMYSNITYTCNYLIRVFPYSFIGIEYQGDGFDDPNRLFFSIKSTLFNNLTQKSDLRELIPEMFYFPPLFDNQNKIQLKKISNGEEIDIVNIEKFHEGNVRYYIFLKDMRKYLEEEKINSWIDLIFGVKKDFYQGNERYYKLENNISFNYDFNNKNYDILMQEYDFGVLPLQILKQKFPEKPRISDNLKNEILKLNKKKFTKDHINCLIEGKESFICKGEKGINNKYLKIINKIQNEKKNFFSKIIYNQIFSNNPKENNNLKYLFVGDVFGNLSIYKKLKISKSENNSNIFFQEICPEKKIIDKIKNKKEENKEYELIKTLNDHTSEIKYIDYNPRLNLVVDYALDGYINLYTMPQLKLILSIHIKDYNIKEPINYIVLISNPFPMICCINSEYIVVFDINGNFFNKIVLEEKNIFFNIDKNCGLFNDDISCLKNTKEYQYPLVPINNYPNKSDNLTNK